MERVRVMNPPRHPGAPESRAAMRPRAAAEVEAPMHSAQSLDLTVTVCDQGCFASGMLGCPGPNHPNSGRNHFRTGMIFGPRDLPAGSSVGRRPPGPVRELEQYLVRNLGFLLKRQGDASKRSSEDASEKPKNAKSCSILEGLTDLAASCARALELAWDPFFDHFRQCELMTSGSGFLIRQFLKCVLKGVQYGLLQ